MRSYWWSWWWWWLCVVNVCCVFFLFVFIGQVLLQSRASFECAFFPALLIFHSFLYLFPSFSLARVIFGGSSVKLLFVFLLVCRRRRRRCRRRHLYNFDFGKRPVGADIVWLSTIFFGCVLQSQLCLCF